MLRFPFGDRGEAVLDRKRMLRCVVQPGGEADSSPRGGLPRRFGDRLIKRDRELLDSHADEW